MITVRRALVEPKDVQQQGVKLVLLDLDPHRKNFGCGSINPPGDRRFESMFPSTRIPCWVPIFDPQPLWCMGRWEKRGGLMQRFVPEKTNPLQGGQMCFV